MLLELHAHTSEHSGCSTIDPVSFVKLAMKKGLQGIIITEHHYLWSEEEIKALRLKAEVPEHFIILSAQEVSTDIGHVLVYGAENSIENDTPLKTLRKSCPACALVWAHPFRGGSLPKDKELLNPLLDAVEIFSLNQTVRENYEGLKAWHKLKFTATSGSDTHSDEMVGFFPIIFDHQINNIQDVAREIKASRCRPFFKEIPKSGSNILVTEITIGAKGEDEIRNRLIVKEIKDDKKWEKAEEAARICRNVYEKGFSESIYRVPEIIEVNPKEKIIIEEGQRGKSLFEMLIHVSVEIGRKYIEISAGWLAKLHELNLKYGNAQETIKKEEKRFVNYWRIFTDTKNSRLSDAGRLIDFVQSEEEKLLKGTSAEFVQLHGDFHPKNIIIGQDRIHDPSTLYVSVIDFGSSFLFLPAFDAGYFLSQFKSQLANYPQVLKNYPEEIFLNSYLNQTRHKEKNLNKMIKLFEIRANLSICSYLIKVGKGESKELFAIINKSLNLYNEYIK